MLAHLAIRDIVLIEKLDLALDAGLTVMTGETGAGKSILLDAFALALGGRGDGGLVRHGQPQGQVTAAFDLAASHPALRLASEQGIDPEGGLILRRTQWADGRTRAFINDQPVSVQAMRAIGNLLVEIHGQHDDRALMDASLHRDILDAFGGLGADVAQVTAAAISLKAARDALTARLRAVEAARKEADFLRHAAEELCKLAPEAGEEASLASQRQGMMQAEKVTQDLREAALALSGSGSPVASLAGVVRRLERRAEQAPLLVEPSIKSLYAAINALEESSQVLDKALRDAAYDPRELERTEERLFALRAAARKYERPVDDLPALAERYLAELEALEAGEVDLTRLEAALATAESTYVTAAAGLSARRKEAAAALDLAVMAELPPLKLERASFLTTIICDTQARGEGGYDRAEFWVRTNPGTNPGPMLKVASGGELSRFMLALKVALADRGSAPTLVFDEIDTGVGGAVADAIGERLARLAGTVQVISVTHAPQVAAKAAQHLLIAKASAGDGARVSTSVEPLAATARREELARMLAGASITQEARAAAQTLLDAAGQA
jgi:DNA repair protein RecN (Recombination protein N)